MTKKTKDDYPYIRAWGKFLGSRKYYIDMQVAEAYRDSAPYDAIFNSGEGWHRYANVTNQHTREKVDQILKTMGVTND